MSCCGGSRPQRVRRQVTEAAPAAEKQVIQRKIGQAAQPVSVQRQYVIPRQQCAKCGYPTIIVTIAGRERHQCSNVNCRTVQ